MLIVESISKIRRMYHIQNKSIKAIAKELSISRNTVRKIIRSNATRFEMAEYNRTTVGLDGYLPRLKQMLEENTKEPLRRRLTAKRLHELLKAEGFSGSYESVNLVVRKYRREYESKGKQVFVPLSFEAGQAFQFDWGTEEVEIAGTIVRVKAARIKLCYSRYSLVIIYPNEQLEMVIDAHNEAFAFFGGCCKSGIYDNMKTAINMILNGKDREVNAHFAELASFHLFDIIACTPASGWEKGQVEKQVGDSRRNFFTPLLRGNSYEQINARLKEMCIDLAASHKHPEFKEQTIYEIYLKEKPYLIGYRGRFTSYRLYPTVVSPLSTVNYAANAYSVECAYVGRLVQIKPEAWQISILHEGKIIGKHMRSFAHGKKIYNPWHYVPALQRKPGALRNGAPFKELMETLPLVFRQIRQRLEVYPDGDKQFINILLLVMKYSLEAVTAACLQTIASGGCSFDLVKSYLGGSIDDSAASEFIQLKVPPSDDCEIYNLMYLSNGGRA